jgi:hypothetical protein
LNLNGHLIKTSTLIVMLGLAAQAGAQTTQTETAIAETTAPAASATSASLESTVPAETEPAAELTTEPAVPAPSVESTLTTSPQAQTTTPVIADTATSPTAPDTTAPHVAAVLEPVVKITLPTSLHPPVVPDGTGTSVTLPTGTIYQVLRAGTGREAGTSATRAIHYVLWLKDGTYVESSRDRELPTPFEFNPGTDEAIKGMEEGTKGMRVGEARKLFVPAVRAYGEEVHGAIPANSDLIFVVELVDLKDPAKAAAAADPAGEMPGAE